MGIIELLIAILVGVVFVEGSTELLCKSEIFSLPREWLKRGESGLRSFFGRMIRCGYCTSVWVAKFPAFVVSYILPFSWLYTPIVFLFSLVFFHRVANYLHNFNDKFLDKYYDPRFTVKE